MDKVYLLGDQPFTCPVCGRRTSLGEDDRENCPEHGPILTEIEEKTDEE